jgi:hypothetical protein
VKKKCGSDEEVRECGKCRKKVREWGRTAHLYLQSSDVVVYIWHQMIVVDEKPFNTAWLQAVK